jgi:hypothetical protein
MLIQTIAGFPSIIVLLTGILSYLKKMVSSNGFTYGNNSISASATTSFVPFFFALLYTPESIVKKDLTIYLIKLKA